MPAHRLDRFASDTDGGPAAPGAPEALAGHLRQIAVGLRIIAVGLGVAALAALGHVMLLCR